ncbi:MAG: hypothetical protein MPW16_21100 (plasmid) [Candidatus Manganitrophus sp.]|nr:MAG: hypothetical protein MPW16_21100 [Candidatus Manganitrophus sp.]
MKRLLLPFIFLIGTVGEPIGAFGAEEESLPKRSDLEEVLQQVAERNPEIPAARRTKWTRRKSEFHRPAPSTIPMSA